MVMYKGCDVSSHQFNTYRGIISKDGNKFCIVKATEGITYKNPYMQEQADYTVKMGRMLGFYHYARPERNNAKDEAKAFAAAVKPYIGKALFALDYEGRAHDFGQDWAVTFVKEFQRITGVLPLFYTSESYLHLYKKVAATGCGLWVAKYSKNGVNPAPWAFAAIRQTNSAPYDSDTFYGSRKAWAAYCKVIK